MAPGQYYAIDLPPLNTGQGPPLSGGDWYREFIAECARFTVSVGDSLQLEPGNMVGPTQQGVNNLIAEDPGAYWDDASSSVLNSEYAVSPRVVLVPFFDPRLPPQSGRNNVVVTKLGAFFLEGTAGGGDVIGRFIDTTATGIPCAGGLGNGLVKGVALVQ